MKPYNEQTIEELKTHARRIATSSNGSVDMIRRRIVNELGYPYSKDGIACHVSGRQTMLMFWGPNGEIVNI